MFRADEAAKASVEMKTKFIQGFNVENKPGGPYFWEKNGNH